MQAKFNDLLSSMGSVEEIRNVENRWMRRTLGGDRLSRPALLTDDHRNAFASANRTSRELCPLSTIVSNVMLSAKHFATAIAA
jgi:hypothetical protein